MYFFIIDALVNNFFISNKVTNGWLNQFYPKTKWEHNNIIY